MGMNIAARRAAKANRRKAVVAQKRKAELAAASLPGRASRAASAPFHQCLLNAELFTGGIGTLVFVRGTRTSGFSVATFLVDAWCLGVKNTWLRSLDEYEFEFFLDAVETTERLEPIDPCHARRLLREVVSWSRSIGFDPHPDFRAIEPIFGDVNADACDAAFQFGREGKPFYVPGPTESPGLVKLRINQLRSRLGEGGFECAVAA
jgi:hypothetical protein